MESEEISHFPDEFEDFRARSMSGGSLCYNRSVILRNIQDKKNQEEAELIERSVQEALRSNGGHQNVPRDLKPQFSIEWEKCSPRDNNDDQVTGQEERPNNNNAGAFYGLGLSERVPLPFKGDVCVSTPARGVENRYVDSCAEWHLGDMRPRGASCPSRTFARRAEFQQRSLPKTLFPGVTSKDSLSCSEHELRRVRSFTLTSKGLVSEGDRYLQGNLGDHTPSSVSSTVSRVSSPGEAQEVFHVGLGGGAAVGKRSIVKQFIKSEMVGAYLQSFGEL